MKKIFNLLPVFLTSLFFTFLFVTNPALAAIVPEYCQTGQCSVCDLAVLINNIIKFLLQLGFALATMFIVYAGFKIMTSGGDSKKVSEGKNMITTVVVGIAGALIAYLLLTTAFIFFAKSTGSLEISYSNWNFTCPAVFDLQPVDLPKTPTGASVPGATRDQSDCPATDCMPGPRGSGQTGWAGGACRPTTQNTTGMSSGVRCSCYIDNVQKCPSRNGIFNNCPNHVVPLDSACYTSI